MKKVIALGLATILSASLDAGNNGAGQQNWNTANTFLRFETPFQSASPERLALFNTEDLREKHRAAHNGDVQFVILGGQNSNQADAAAYYMPGGLETINFNASFDGNNGSEDSSEILWSGAQGGSAMYARLGSTSTNGNGAIGNLPANSGMAYSTATGASTVTAATLLFSQADPAGAQVAGNLAIATSATLGSQVTHSVTGAIIPGDFVVGNGTPTASGGPIYVAVNTDQIRGLLSDNATTGSQVAVGDMVVDSNANIGLLRPWNFGVGFAPNVQFGAAISESQFVSAISPELKRSFWGIGATWKQLLSTKDTGWFLELSTVLQRVTMNMDLNEVVSSEFPYTLNGPDNGTSSAWLLWQDSWTDNGFNSGNEVAPESITEAFAQEAWLYGKVDGAQSVTRLADIELKLGYQFICEENVMSNMFVGIVIPTGNKAQSVYLAEPIVGNGFHFGLMFGSTQEIQLDMGSKTRWSMRSDSNIRYLFQNTQVRSFDTLTNGQWSRYMMVWPDYATEQANGELQTEAASIRAYTPGINVFTQEMYVTPRAQARINNAIIVEHGSFKGEFGWNMMVRQAEEVSLVNAWADNTIAFVDASNNSNSLFNANRTIYNDSYQSTPLGNGGTGGTAVADASQAMYQNACINAADLNLDSAASAATFTNTPYLAIGYAFNEEKSSVFSLGFSYEMSATNAYINDWTLWGKFGFSF